MQYSTKRSESDVLVLNDNYQRNHLRNVASANLLSKDGTNKSSKRSKGPHVQNVASHFDKNDHNKSTISRDSSYVRDYTTFSHPQNGLNRRHEPSGSLSSSFFESSISKHDNQMDNLSLVSNVKRNIDSLINNTSDTHDEYKLLDETNPLYDHYPPNRYVLSMNSPNHNTNENVNNFLEHHAGNNSMAFFDSIDIYGNSDDQQDINSIFIADETKLPIYIAAFGSGFFSVIISLCMLLYVRYIYTRFKEYKKRSKSSKDGQHPLIITGNGGDIHDMNLAEIRSINPFLTRIEDYVLSCDKNPNLYNRTKSCQETNKISESDMGKNESGQNNPNIIEELFATFGDSTVESCPGFDPDDLNDELESNDTDSNSSCSQSDSESDDSMN